MNFFDKFEEMLEKYNTKILIYNLLNVEYNIDNNNKSLTIAPSEGFLIFRIISRYILWRIQLSNIMLWSFKTTNEMFIWKKNTIV
jgi:hypothetical protein